MASRARTTEAGRSDLVSRWRRRAGLWLLERPEEEPVPAGVDLVTGEAIFRRSFESALVGMCMTSTDGRFLRVNPVFARLLGRPAEELIGMPFADFSHPADLEETALRMAAALAGRSNGFRQQKRYLRPDGSVVYVELSTSLLRAADGTPLHFTTQTIDVTDRHLAELERDMHLGMLRGVIANSQSLIYVKDLDGRYLLANEPFEQAFGVTEAELLGKDDTFLDPILAPVWMENDRRARKGEYHAEEWSDGPDGIRTYESVKLPLLDGDGALYAICGISLDVTERRQALEDVRAAARAIHEAAQAATEANNVKSRFLATMSHEIRTPMHAVIGMTGLLLDTALDGQQRQFVEIIRGSGDALLATINDVLDFSRLGEGEIQLEEHRFNLVDCLDDTLASIGGHAGELDLVAHHGEGCPTYVVGDPHRLRQVLVNLVGNAVKFTERGDVSLTVGLSPGPGSPEGPSVPLTFTVQDTGIGIPPDRMDLIFRSFSQVDASSTRAFGGSGLGLAISRAIVQKMGGDVSVTSQVGVGSTFSFTVALGRSPERHDDRNGREPDLRGRRALLVDDNGASRSFLRAHLERWGILCTECEAGDAALAALSLGAAFDVALVDLHMPGMDGVQLAEVIRGLPGRKHLPLLLLTRLGARPEGPAAELFEAFATKPIRAKRLRSTLGELFAGTIIRLAPVDPAQAEEDEVHPPVGPQVRPGALRVLLAEDNLVNQQVAELMVRKLGHVIDIAADGRQACEALQRTRYDVVLMDVHMPVMDGLEATRSIRTHVDANQPWIIAMTASNSAEDQGNCMRAGMDDYLSKPVRMPELASALDRVPDGPNSAEVVALP